MQIPLSVKRAVDGQYFVVLWYCEQVKMQFFLKKLSDYDFI